MLLFHLATLPRLNFSVVAYIPWITVTENLPFVTQSVPQTLFRDNII